MRDYKPRAREKKRRPSGGTLIGIFIGLVLGLALAAGLALYMTNAPVPFVTRADKARGTPPQADRALAETARSAESKSGDAAKPRFDFYKILPGQEVPVTREGAARGGQAARQVGRRQGPLLRPGRRVPEPGRRRQPEGAARACRAGGERRAGEPARQGHLVPRAARALHPVGRNKSRSRDARAERDRRLAGQNQELNPSPEPQ